MVTAQDSEKILGLNKYFLILINTEHTNLCNYLGDPYFLCTKRWFFINVGVSPKHKEEVKKNIQSKKKGKVYFQFKQLFQKNFIIGVKILQGTIRGNVTISSKNFYFLFYGGRKHRQTEKKQGV